MRKIALTNSEWFFDESSPIGPKGGFGQVYKGNSKDGGAVAVKRLHLQAKDFAHRELDIAGYFVGKDANHIIPYLDTGRDADSDDYFVVMSLADKSLDDLVDSLGHLDEIQSVEISLQIVGGLIEAGDSESPNLWRMQPLKTP